MGRSKIHFNQKETMRAILAFLYYLVVFGIMLIAGIPYTLYCGLRGHWEDCTKICTFAFRNIIFKLFRIKVSVEGAENIPKEKGYVIVANHQSFLDINVIWHSITPAAFMAKASLWKAPVFGWVLDRTGSIPIHKNPRMNAGLGKRLQERFDQNYNIAVFPEGHRSEDGHMFKFQNGIFRLAKEQHFSILPVTFINTGKILPKVKWAVYSGEVKMVIHPLIRYEDYAEKPMAELRDETHDLIESVMPYKQAELAAAKVTENATESAATENKEA